MKKFLRQRAEGAALWVLRRTGFWRRVSTTEGFKRHEAIPGENYARFCAWEGGRHLLLWKLMRGEKVTFK